MSQASPTIEDLLKATLSSGSGRGKEGTYLIPQSTVSLFLPTQPTVPPIQPMSTYCLLPQRLPWRQPRTIPLPSWDVSWRHPKGLPFKILAHTAVRRVPVLHRAFILPEDIACNTKRKSGYYADECRELGRKRT